MKIKYIKIFNNLQPLLYISYWLETKKIYLTVYIMYILYTKLNILKAFQIYKISIFFILDS